MKKSFVGELILVCLLVVSIAALSLAGKGTSNWDSHQVPVTDNTIDLGTASKELKDIYVDGTATVDTLTVNEHATVAESLTVSGAFIVVISSLSSLYTAPATTGTIIVRSDNYNVYVCTKTLTGNVCWVVVGAQS